MAERDVIYRIKTVYDQGGSQAFTAMASQHAAAIKQIDERWKAFSETMKSGAGSAADAVGRSYKSQKNHAKDFYDYVGAENKKLVDAIKERERAEEMARRTSERAMAQIRAGNAQMREGFMNTAEGVTRVARGLTLMGFVSDENLQKLLKTLAAVQGISDVVLGSVKAYSALQKAVDGYTIAVNAARAAEAARAGTAAAGSAAGGAGALAGGAGIGTLAAGGAAAAAAIAGVAFALIQLAETANGTALEVDSFTSSTGRWIEDFNRSVNEAFGGRVAESEPFNEAYREHQRRQLNERMATIGLQYSREQPVATEAARRAGVDRLLSLQGPGGAANFGLIDQEMANARKWGGNYLEMAQSSAGADKAFLQEQAVRAQERLLDLTRMRASEEERIRQSSISYHQAAITAAQQELAILREQQDAAANRLESARDRFGAMGSWDQARLTSLGGLMNTANDLRAAGRTEEAKAIEARFTRDDLSLLRGVGLEGTDAFTGRLFGERADRGGFGVFGGEERKRAAELAPRIESLIAETTVNVEAKFKLELDQEQAREALDRALRPVIEQLNRLAAEQVQLKLNADRTARENAARQGLSRRGN